MKKFLKIFIVIFLIFIYVYVCNISNIPENIVLFEGESLNLKIAKGLNLSEKNSYDVKLTSSNLNSKISEAGNTTLNVNLFGGIKVKEVSVDVISNTKVVPLGTAIGMKLYTKGVLVVGMTEINTDNNKKEKPYENSGIEEGDTIIQINDKEISSTNQLIEEVNKSNGNTLNITFIKDEKTMQTSITPVKSNNEYKIGLWVRDVAAGVGTLTFYEPSTNSFMSLGHGILDIDTEKIIDIASGELVTANIVSIQKGEKGTPGAVRGIIETGTIIGKIYENTSFGVYGELTNKSYAGVDISKEVAAATRNEIKTGQAQIICQLDNSGPKTYNIEIEKIYKNNNENNKSMLIKITDEELLEKTGGIIQGMSGAPILQDGKFIGAVTNVLVNDPTQGYGIFADLLIKQMRSS